MSVDFGIALGFIAELTFLTTQEIKSNRKKTLHEYVTDNYVCFSDWEVNQKLFTFDHPIWKITIGQLILLATQKLRVISAPDNQDRKCISSKLQGDESRLKRHLCIQSHMQDMPMESSVGMKYSTEFNKYNTYCPPNEDLSKILIEIFETDNLLDLYQKELYIFKDNGKFYIPADKWELICCDETARRIQLLVYDLLRQSAYNKSEQICPEQFDMAIKGFSVERNQRITEMLEKYCDCADIVLGTEMHVKNYQLGQKWLLEKGKSGDVSGIFTKPEHGSLTPIHYDEHDSASTNLVAGQLDEIALFSVHTPTDGSATVKIVSDILKWFYDTYTMNHLIIGIDANTKDVEQLRNLVKILFKWKASLAYFAGKSVDEVMQSILERQKIEKTSSGRRTFAIQSQFGKAGEMANHYVDFIILASKEDAEPIKVLKTTNFKNVMLCNDNPSDHAPREVVIQVNGKTFSVVLWNTAGRNDNLLEYST